jgi:DNA-binding NarL/FixJ family response regulator
LENHGRKQDAILVDVATFLGSGQELSELIERCARLGPVMLLVRDDRIDQIIAGFRSGAVGLVRQTASETDLRRALNTVMAGSIWCDKQIFQRIAHYLLPVHQFSARNLTQREKEVLQCVGRGDSNKEIAQRLQISIQSVKVYLSNLPRKTGVPNRGALALHAVASEDGVI